MNDWLDLDNRLCVVTGAAGGIGSAIARGLAAAGARLVLVDLTAQACAALQRELMDHGCEVLTLEADISREAAVQRLVQQTEAAMGACEVLVNTPAISGRPDALIDLSHAKWLQQMQVNLGGYLLCSQHYARPMLALGRGSLIHVGSIAGEFPQPRSGAYSMAKAGVSMMSRVLALDLGPQGVRSNVVSPGMIRTPLSERFYSDPEMLRRRQAFVPLRSVGTPQQVADAVVYLASPRSGYITGQDISVDGGVGLTLMDLFPRPQ